MESTLIIQRENLGPCQVKLNIEVPAATVRAEFMKIADEFRFHGKIHGFRPGKAPEAIVRRQFGDRLVQEARRELLKKMTEAAIMQEQLQPETRPSVVDRDQLQYRDDAAFRFSVKFDLAPAVQVPDVSAINIECDEATVSETDVDETIRGWIQRNAGFTTVERAAQANDMLKVSWKAELAEPLAADAPLPEHSKYLLENEDGWLLLKSPEIIPGATAGMVGAAAGETRTFAVVFPEDHFVKALAGRQARYTVTVKEVQEPDQVQLTDELASQYGHKDAAEMKTVVAGHLQREAQHKSNQARRKQLADQLLKGAEFPLPPTILAYEEFENFSHLYRAEMRNNRSKEEVDADREKIMAQARAMTADELRLRYLLEAVAENVKIKVSKEELDQAVESVARMHRQPLKVMYRKLGESGRLDDLYRNVRDNKVMDYLLARCKINGQSQPAKAD